MFRLDEHILEALASIRDRDGIGISEQVRQALRAWIHSRNAPSSHDARTARPVRGRRGLAV
jgi:hypothetical protein